jgi:hypothetical protein
VDEGVEARAGRHVAREVVREPGVDERERGAEPLVADHPLYPLVCHDGGLCHLRSGAAGRRDGDERGDLAGELPGPDVLARVAAVGEEDRDDLRVVHGGAAADGHDAVDSAAGSESKSPVEGSVVASTDSWPSRPAVASARTPASRTPVSVTTSGESTPRRSRTSGSSRTTPSP